MEGEAYKYKNIHLLWCGDIVIMQGETLNLIFSKQPCSNKTQHIAQFCCELNSLKHIILKWKIIQTSPRNSDDLNISRNKSTDGLGEKHICPSVHILWNNRAVWIVTRPIIYSKKNYTNLTKSLLTLQTAGQNVTSLIY